jgi:asparagine synthetase B (glutamine-hydrolysing)
LSATEATRQGRLVSEQQPTRWVAVLDRDRGRGDAGAASLQVEAIGGTPPQEATEDVYRVVFEGWLYNRAELEAVAGVPSTVDDALLILRVYRALGEGVVDRIKGRFVLLIWDGARGELICVRDPLGSYPLFYAPRDGEVLLSTGIEDLVRQPGVSAALNRVVIAEHLCSRLSGIEETYYEAVRRVPQGHLLSWGAGEPQARRYWDPVPAPGSDDWIGEEELEQFDQILEQAVGRCLEMGPPGIFLSGGLDSVSIAAMAADLCEAREVPAPWALSLVFPHPDTDESKTQRAVAAQLGLPQVLIGYDEAVAPAARVEAAVEGSRDAPAPLVGIWPPAYWRLAAEGKRRGCQVILTGGGGDEMLLTSPYVAADLMRRFEVGGLWRLYRQSWRSSSRSPLSIAKSVFWSNSARLLLVRNARRVRGSVAQSVLRERWRRQIAEGTPPWVRPDPQLRSELEARAIEEAASWPPASGSFLDSENRSYLDNPVNSIEMERLFEEGRRVGIPIVEPYWDADLQEFLYRVPPELLASSGRTKGLVRAMLARRFPTLGFERQRKVVGTAFAFDTFHSELPIALRAIGGARALADLGLVDRHKLDEAVVRFASSPSEHWRGNSLWHVLSLEAWVRPRL